MPMPKKDEKKEDFMERCIPMVIEEGTAEDDSQASAMCQVMWEEGKKKMEPAMAKAWYEIEGRADVSTIWLYDEIGASGIGAKEFISELNAIKSPKIDMHINSPGGEVFEGAAIYNAIKRHPAYVTVFIDGMAASIASVIAIAGQKTVMARNGIYMIHNPHTSRLSGDAGVLRRTANILDKVRNTMVGAYMEKTGRPEAEIVEMMDVETTFEAREAMEYGFVDMVGDGIDLAACANFGPILSKVGFKNIPNFNAKKELPSEREIERVLREAGCTQRQAKAILAEGYRADYRDDDPAAVSDPPEQDHRDDDLAAQRDAVQPLEARTEPTATQDPPAPALDWLAELRIKAERIAPSMSTH